MPKLRNSCLAASLLICAACSKNSEVASVPAPQAYRGIPAGLMERCAVNDVALETTADLVISRSRYKDGFEKCAAKVDAIRDFDAKARKAGALGTGN